MTKKDTLQSMIPGLEAQLSSDPNGSKKVRIGRRVTEFIAKRMTETAKEAVSPSEPHPNSRVQAYLDGHPGATVDEALIYIRRLDREAAEEDKTSLYRS